MVVSNGDKTYYYNSSYLFMYMLINPDYAGGVTFFLLYMKRTMKSIFGHIGWLRVTSEIMFGATETHFMLIEPIETVGDAFACENYHSEGLCLNMSEPPTAVKIIQEA